MSRKTANRASKGVEWLARIGYAANGVVYGTIGSLAAITTLGSGGSGQTTGPKGAVSAIGSEPFGRIPLAIVALGLLCYVIWCMTQALLDPEHNGNDVGGLFKRAVLLVTGLIYGLLTFYTARLALGLGGGHAKDRLTARLMSDPGGIWIVMTIGAIIAGVGIAQFVLAYRQTYKTRWNLREMGAVQKRWAGAIAKWGLGARGAVFLISGGFLIAAGWQTKPNEATGLGGALYKLAQQRYGAWLLVAVALGLVCYGLYCMIDAVYARIDP